MSYNMQLANEKLDAEKNVYCNIKEYNISKTNIKDIN